MLHSTSYIRALYAVRQNRPKERTLMRCIYFIEALSQYKINTPQKVLSYNEGAKRPMLRVLFQLFSPTADRSHPLSIF
jgi:hypothetical protein